MKTWTVKPYYTPHEEFDPLGVFEIQEVKAEAESWNDASLDADPNSDEEQAALDRRDKVTSEAMALIAATPELLELAQQIVLERENSRNDQIPDDIYQGAVRAIAKAKGEIK
jgi:hypothetical protein